MNENQAVDPNGDRSRWTILYTNDNIVAHCFPYGFKMQNALRYLLEYFSAYLNNKDTFDHS